VVAVVWQFEVREDRQAEFERFCGADGDWTKLSRRSRSFLGSSFLKDLAQPTRYLLVEYWSEMVVYERHRADFEREVAALEQRRAEYLAGVEPRGVFTALDVPSREGPTWSRRRGV
jgi:quinol monooxygenase YgiN